MSYFDTLPDELIEEIVIRIKYTRDILTFTETFRGSQNLFNNIGSLQNNQRLFKVLFRIHYLQYYQILKTFTQDTYGSYGSCGTWYQLFEILHNIFITLGFPSAKYIEPEDIAFQEGSNKPRFHNIIYEIIFARNYPKYYERLKDTGSIGGVQETIQWFFLYRFYDDCYGIQPKYSNPKRRTYQQETYFEQSYPSITPYDLMISIFNIGPNASNVMKVLCSLQEILEYMREYLSSLTSSFDQTKTELFEFLLYNTGLNEVDIQQYRKRKETHIMLWSVD